MKRETENAKANPFGQFKFSKAVSQTKYRKEFDCKQALARRKSEQLKEELELKKLLQSY